MPKTGFTNVSSVIKKEDTKEKKSGNKKASESEADDYPGIFSHSFNNVLEHHAQLVYSDMRHRDRTRFNVFSFQNGGALAAYPVVDDLGRTDGTFSVPRARTRAAVHLCVLLVTSPAKFVALRAFSLVLNDHLVVGGLDWRTATKTSNPIHHHCTKKES